MIRGQGMPSYRHHDYGHLYVQFEVVLPTIEEFEEDGRAEKIPMLREILPTPRYLNAPPDEAMKEDYPLETLDSIQQARAQGAPAHDEEDGPTGGERVQCASQ